MLVFVAMAIVVLALQIEQFVAGQQLNRPVWTVAEVQDLSAFIARYVKGGTVATLYPAIVLDAGSPIYPEFSTSPYFFRAADHLAPERVLELNGVSPKTLPLVLAAKPPSAVFTGNAAERSAIIELGPGTIVISKLTSLSGKAVPTSRSFGILIYSCVLMNANVVGVDEDAYACYSKPRSNLAS